MEVPENALSIPTVAYTTLKTLLNKCVTSQYRLGKDNTKLALELLACMEGHISNPASTEDALPVMDSLPQRASSLTKSITLSDLQETLKATENNIVARLKEAEARQRDPSATTTPTTVRQTMAGKARELEVVVSLAKVDKSHSLRKSPPGTIKALVEEALKKSDSLDLANAKVHGVRTLPNGNIVVQATEEKGAADILLHADKWTPLLAQGSAVSRKTYTVLANFVPTDFDPSTAIATTVLHSQNSTIIAHPNNITNIRWLHSQQTKMQTKKHSSLLISLNDPHMADEAIKKGISVNGAMCSTHKFIPPPTQCYRCQQFGHTATACPSKDDPSQAKCARCAGNHPTRDCTCTHQVKCANLRTCTHIQIQCANCGKEHKSFDSTCTEKIRATAAILQRPEYTTPYFTAGNNQSRHGARPA